MELARRFAPAPRAECRGLRPAPRSSILLRRERAEHDRRTRLACSVRHCRSGSPAPARRGRHRARASEGRQRASTTVLRSASGPAQRSSAVATTSPISTGSRRSSIGAGLELRHVEQICHEAAEPLSLGLDHGDQFVALLRARRASPYWRSDVAAPVIEASGVFRSCDSEASNAERSRSVFGGNPRFVDAACKLYALDRDGGLVAKRIEQPALVGSKQRRRFAASSARPRRPKPRPVPIGRNSRLAPASVSAPRPAGLLFSNAHLAAPRSASSS